MSAEVCLSRQRGLKGVKHFAHFYRIVTLVFACPSDVVLDARPRPRGALRPIFIGLALASGPMALALAFASNVLGLDLESCIDNFFHHLQMQQER